MFEFMFSKFWKLLKCDLMLSYGILYVCIFKSIKIDLSICGRKRRRFTSEEEAWYFKDVSCLPRAGRNWRGRGSEGTRLHRRGAGQLPITDDPIVVRFLLFFIAFWTSLCSILMGFVVPSWRSRRTQMAHLGRPGASWPHLGRFLGSFQRKKALEQDESAFVKVFAPF